MEVIKKCYGVLILLITVFYFDSPIAIAIGGAASALISCFVNASPNKKLLNYSYFEQVMDILPSMAISAVMGSIVYCVSLLGLANWLTLIIQIPVGIIVYIGLAEIFKLECYTYLKNMIFGFLKKRKKAK